MGNDTHSVAEADLYDASKPPLVSVVMANYNGAAYLADAIASAQAQTLRAIEIIVSDDGSNDDSIAIVDRAMTNDARVRLLQSAQNRGPAAARNRAIGKARGEWIAVMDSDDLMDPHRLAKLVQWAERDDAEIIADNFTEFFQDGSMPPRPLLRGQWLAGPRWIDMIEYVRHNLFYVGGPALGYLKPLFRRSMLASAQYDETLPIGEDYDLVVRLLHAGRKLRVYPEPLYFYRRHRPAVAGQTFAAPYQALQSANDRLLQQLSPDERAEREILMARRHSIDTAVAFDQLLIALRYRRWAEALRLARQQPRAVLLLRIPVQKRLLGWPRPLWNRFRAFQPAAVAAQT